MAPKKTPSKAPAKGKPGSAAKKIKEPEGPTEAEILRAEALSVAPVVIADMIERALSVHERARLNARTPSYTASLLRASMAHVVQAYHVEADPGEPDLLDRTWGADDEPVAAANDTWSRAVFRTMQSERAGKGRPRTAASLPPPGGLEPVSEGFMPPPNLRGTGMRASSASIVSTSSNKEGATRSLAAERAAFDAPPPPKAKEDTHPKVDVTKVELEAQRVPARSDADAEVRLTTASRLARQLARESNVERQLVEQMREALGGREYVYTAAGRPAVPAAPPLMPDTMPRLLASSAARISENVLVHDPLGARAAAEGGAELSRAVSSRRTQQQAAAAAAAAAATPGQNGAPLLTTADSSVLEWQPQLLDVMAPASGVRVQEAGTEAYGGPLPIEPEHIPVRVYEKLVDGRNMSVVIGQEEARRALSASPPPDERNKLSRPASSQPGGRSGVASPRGGAATLATRDLLPLAPGSAAPGSAGAAGGWERRGSAGGIAAASIAVPGATPGAMSRHASSARPATSGATAGATPFDRGRPRAPSPERGVWPRTPEYAPLRQRERDPVAAHNLPGATRPMLSRQRSRDGTPLGATADTLRLARGKGAGARGTLSVHSKLRQDDLLKPSTPRRKVL